MIRRCASRPIGDTSLLLRRRDKPFVAVRQHVPITLENPRSTDIIGENVSFSLTDDGGVSLYRGLVSGTVQVTAGKERQTVEVNDDGITEVLVRLGEH